MNGKSILMGVLALLGVALLLSTSRDTAYSAAPTTPTSPAPKGSLNPNACVLYDFEPDGARDPWVVGYDICDGSRGELQRKTGDTCSGVGYALLKETVPATCSRDPSAVWMQASYTLKASVSGNAYVGSLTGILAGCGSCDVIAYIGTTPPTSRDQFKDLGPEPTDPCSTFFSFEKGVSCQPCPGSTYNVYVAIGYETNEPGDHQVLHDYVVVCTP